jgi:hypothetical protein
MLPSEADSQSAGFNLLPHATVGGVRIELTDTGAQNRRPTLGHPSANARAKPPNLTGLTRSLELESNEPLLLFRQALSPGQLSRVTVPHSRNAPRITAVGAGIEPAEGALTVRPVYQHTSPTEIGKRPMGYKPLPPYTGDRLAHHCTPSRRFELSEIRRHTFAFGCARRESNPDRRVKNPLLGPMSYKRRYTFGVAREAPPTQAVSPERIELSPHRVKTWHAAVTPQTRYQRIRRLIVSIILNTPLLSGEWARTESNGLAKARRLQRRSPSEDEPRTPEKSKKPQKREKPPRLPGRLSLKNQYKTRPYVPQPRTSIN